MGLNALFRSERPVSRSELRMFVGKLYFTWRKITNECMLDQRKAE
ncbi:MAG TPA: hypothetical protein VFC58_12980 [Desulfosporosinus sp.]|nr:hypothetical protein [Desulfosporosinus sp.]